MEQNKNIDRERLCFSLLSKVFNKGSYSQIELNKGIDRIEPNAKPYITHLYYGVIEKSIQFDYIIASLTTKPCPLDAQIVLKMGLYLLRYSSTPAYACINKSVDLIKSTKSFGLSGFVNAVLKKSMDFVLPDELHLKLSCPKWLVDNLKQYYTDDYIEQLLFKGDNTKTHIRINEIKFDPKQSEKKIKPFTRSQLGYSLNFPQLKSLRHDEYAIQSLSSMLAVKGYLSGESFKNVLDLCGAPGGKAVYLKQLSPLSNVICCDIHPHRISLIQKYCYKLGANIVAKLNDATILKNSWVNKFDLVICDVPCSGFGVKSKPDIFLNRQQQDILSLSKLQSQILNISSKYVRVDGVLCYSTCTILKQENEQIIEQFLDKNPNFKLEIIKTEHLDALGMVNILPQQFNSDAFFVARMRRVK